MQNLSFAALLLMATSGAAVAADLPATTPPVDIPVLPSFTWTGAYIGGNAGYAFDERTRFNTFNGTGNATGVPALRPPVATGTANGFTGGAQIGYDYQFGAGSGVVVGLEADAAYTDLHHTTSITLGSGPSLLHSDMNFFGTVRGRLGYAVDRVMLYGTGGFAYGDVSVNSRFFSAGGTMLYSGGHSGVQTGYTYGGGIEYAISTESLLNVFHAKAVTVGVEYLYYNLGSVGVSVPVTVAGAAAGATGAYTQKIKTTGDLVRFGLNFKF